MSSSSTVSTESRRWFFKMTAFASLGPMEVYHFAVFQTALEGIRKLEGHDSPSFPDIRENLIRGDIMPEPSTFLDKSLPVCSLPSGPPTSRSTNRAVRRRAASRPSHQLETNLEYTR